MTAPLCLHEQWDMREYLLNHILHTVLQPIDNKNMWNELVVSDKSYQLHRLVLPSINSLTDKNVARILASLQHINEKIPFLEENPKLEVIEP